MSKMIAITGESAQGKTPITTELKREYGLYAIHTDGFSYAMVDHRIGENYSEKRKWVRSHKGRITETFVLEGVHACKEAELQVYAEILGVTEIHRFRLNNPNHEAQFAFKHRKSSYRELAKAKPLEKCRQKYVEWFNGIYDLEATEVSSYMELENILIERGLIDVPAENKNRKES